MKASKFDTAVFCLGVYTGYKFINKAFGAICKNDPFYSLGSKVLGLGFGSMLGGMAASELRLIRNTVNDHFSESKPTSGHYKWEDCQEQGMNDAAETANKENENERAESEAESGINSVE